MEQVLILHASQRFGGAEKSLLDLMECLSDPEGFLLWLHPASEVYRLGCEKKLRVKAGDIRYAVKKEVKRNSWKWIRHWFAESHKISRFCRKNGISRIYCHTHRSLPYCFLPRLRGIKVVTGCRDNVSTTLEKKMIHWLSDRVLPVSDYIKQQLHREAKATMVPPPVLIHPPSPSFDLKGEYGLPADTVCIGTLSAVVRWKNPADFIEIARRLCAELTDTPLHFFVVGEVLDEAYRIELEKYINEHRLQDRITFTGYRENNADYLAGFDLLVHTAIGEPYGRVIEEALKMGKTVMTYDGGGPGEIIRKKGNGFLAAPGDVETMKELIREQLTNGTLTLKRENIGAQAFEDDNTRRILLFKKALEKI